MTYVFHVETIIIESSITYIIRICVKYKTTASDTEIKSVICLSRSGAEIKPAMAAKDERVATGSVEVNMYHLSGYPYRNMVSSLNKSDIITGEQFKHSELHGYFNIDRTNLYKNGKFNPNHVFELFGSYSGHTYSQVRVMTLQAIAANVQFYKDISSVCLGMRGSYFEKWLTDIADPTCPCDELGLLTLSYLYKRHCLVFTASKLWSTIELAGPMSLLEALNECTVRLIYLGDLEFGVLKPIQSVPLAPSTQTVNTSKCSTDTVTLPVESTATVVHVETDKADANRPPSPSSVYVETKFIPNIVKEEQVDATSTSPAEDTDPSEGLVYSVLEPSSYVFEKNLQIKLQKLSIEEIARWTGSPCDSSTSTRGYRLRARKTRASRSQISLRNSKVVNYRPMLTVSKKDVPSLKPCTTRYSKRPKPSGPSTSRIQANKLILKAKLFTTKPVANKYPAPDLNIETSLRTVPVETPPSPVVSTVHVETYDVSTDEYETAEPPVVTGNKSPTEVPTVPTDNGKPKRKRGQVSIKSYVLKKKNKAPRTAYCKLCEFSCLSVRALNEHHRSDHGIQFCSVCNKGFNTQTALDKHSYVHGENNFVCETCGKSFPFSSRLEQHKLTHKDVRLFCMKTTCGKFFKSVGDLNRHVSTHNATHVYYCDFCTYSNVDKRNTESHMRTHVVGNERYSCPLCGKKFRFSTQNSGTNVLVVT